MVSKVSNSIASRAIKFYSCRGEGGYITPFFFSFFNKAEGRLSLYEVDRNLYPALRSDGTKIFVKKIGTRHVFPG